MITLLIRMAICENTVTFSLTLLRDLLSFENWRGGGGANGIRGGGSAPPAPPLATALKFLIFKCELTFDKRDFLNYCIYSYYLFIYFNISTNIY